MELVAATVGGPWTDRPLCTPAVLANVARTVNDHTSAKARPLLAPMIPYLMTDPARIDEVEADLNACLAVFTAASAFASTDLVDTLTQQLDRVVDEAAFPTGRRWLSRHVNGGLAAADHHRAHPASHAQRRRLVEHAGT